MSSLTCLKCIYFLESSNDLISPKRHHLNPFKLVRKRLLSRHVSVISTSLTAVVLASHVRQLGSQLRSLVNCDPNNDWVTSNSRNYFQQFTTRGFHNSNSKMSASGSSPTQSSSPKRSSSPKPSQPPVIIKPKETHTATVSMKELSSIFKK